MTDLKTRITKLSPKQRSVLAHKLAKANRRDDVISTGEKRLVAYIVSDRESPRSVELRNFLKKMFLDYMIPSEFVFVDHLPLTSNGKIDRKALPDPDRKDEQRGYVPPRTPTEVAMSSVWAEALNIEKVGIRDNFFDIGGHSLAAVRLVDIAEKRLRKKLQVSAIFSHPTVEGLSRFVEKNEASPTLTPLVPFLTGGDRIPIFLVHYGNGEVFFFNELAQRLGDTQPFYALRASGLDTGTEPVTDIREMAATYIRSIRSVQETGPYLIGGYCFGGVAAYEMARQLGQQGEKVKALMLINSPAPHLFGRNSSADGSSRSFMHFMWSFGQLTETDLFPHYCEIREITQDEDMLRNVLSDIRSLSDTERLETLRECAERGGFPLGRAETGYLERAFRVLRTNARLESDYIPEPYAGNMIFFSAAGNSDFTGEAEFHRIRRAIRGPEADDTETEVPPALGWERHCDTITCHIVPGNHFSLFREPNVSVLAEKMRQALSEL